MQKLKELRLQNGLLQKDVAKALRISNQCYQGYESGNRSPDPNMLIALADFFGCSVDYLLGREKNAITPKGATDIATNFIKELKLENDKRFKDLAKLYSMIPDINRVYVLAYLVGYLNKSGINTVEIIGY